MKAERQEDADRQILVSYILGTMADEDRLSVGERCFSDDDLFDELLLVETDLLDEYVRGQLGPEERVRFERYISSLPDAHHRVAAANALMRVVSEQHPSEARTERAPRWLQALQLFRPSPAVIACSLAALATGMVIVLIWLIGSTRQLRTENEFLRSQVNGLNSAVEALEQDKNALDRHNADIEMKIEQLKKDLEKTRPEEDIARIDSQTATNISLELTAASRDPSIPDTLYLPAGARFISLRAPGPQQRYSTYRAVIQTTDGAILWKQGPVQSRQGGQDIVLRIEASQLPPASYKLTLVLTAPKRTDIAQDYYFKVVKP